MLSLTGSYIYNGQGAVGYDATVEKVWNNLVDRPSDYWRYVGSTLTVSGNLAWFTKAGWLQFVGEVAGTAGDEMRDHSPSLETIFSAIPPAASSIIAGGRVDNTKQLFNETELGKKANGKVLKTGQRVQGQAVYQLTLSPTYCH